MEAVEVDPQSTFIVILRCGVTINGFPSLVPENKIVIK